jgi:hypothetical protein
LYAVSLMMMPSSMGLMGRYTQIKTIIMRQGMHERMVSHDYVWMHEFTSSIS